MNESGAQPLPFPNRPTGGVATTAAAVGSSAGQQIEVKWDPTLLEGDVAAAVGAFQRSVHGFAKRLEPRKRAKFVLALDSALYSLQGEAAIEAEGGLHPKHRLMQYHDFFVGRIRKDERVIDLGCGVGALACAIASRSGAWVTGMDWSRKNLDGAAARAKSMGLSPAPIFHSGDITMARVEGQFGVVVLSNVLEHIAERPRRLRTWLSWYGPSRFLIRVPAFDRDWRVPYKKELGVEWRLDLTHETEYTREQLTRELGHAGLRIVDLQAVWGEYWLEARPA